MIGFVLQEDEALWVCARTRKDAKVVLEQAACVALPREVDREAHEDESEAPFAVERRRARLAAERLAEQLGVSRLRGDVRVAISGAESIVRYVHLPMVPPWRLRLLMEAEIAEAEERVGEPLSADFRLLSLPSEERSMGAEGLPLAVMIALTKQGALQARIDGLEEGGSEVVAALPAALALFDAWVALGHTEPDRTTLLVDVGVRSTEVAIARGGFLLFARSLPGTASAEDERELGRLVASLGSTLHFARDQQKLKRLEIDEIRLSGRFARAQALQRRVAAALRAPVALFDPLERVELAPKARQGLEQTGVQGERFVIALGLALAGSHPRTIALDMLPARAARRLDFNRRLRWLYAAAAVVLLAIAAVWTVSFIDRARANERLRALRANRAVLEARLDRLETLSKKNRRTLEELASFQRRSEAGAGAERLFEVMLDHLGSDMAIEQVRYPAALAPRAAGRAKSAAGEKGSGLEFEVHGLIDDGEGGALDRLKAFEAALRADPRIEAVRIAGTPQERPGAMRAFVLLVRVRPGAGGAS